MSSLRELVYNNKCAKVVLELEPIILEDESVEKVQNVIKLPIFYVKICDGYFMKIILNDESCDRDSTFLIDDHGLNVDSFLIGMGKPVLGDRLKYSDGHDKSNYSTPVPEPARLYCRKSTLFDGKIDLPVEVANFIEELRNPSKKPGNDYIS